MAEIAAYEAHRLVAQIGTEQRYWSIGLCFWATVIVQDSAYFIRVTSAVSVRSHL